MRTIRVNSKRERLENAIIDAGGWIVGYGFLSTRFEFDGPGKASKVANTAAIIGFWADYHEDSVTLEVHWYNLTESVPPRLLFGH